MKDNKGTALAANRRVMMGVGGACLLLLLYPLWGSNVYGGRNSINDQLQSNLFVENSGTCDNEVMFGLEEDAGWWLCWPKEYKASKRDCKILSWGIQDHFSFDEAVVKAGCDVHGFDPSPLGLSSHKRYTEMGGMYHPYGLGGIDKTYGPGQVPFNWPGIKYLQARNSEPWTLKSVVSTLQDVGHMPASTISTGGKSLMVLKIDVEGTEWDVLDQLVDAHWDQLLLELHFPPTEYHLSEVGHKKGFVVTRLPQSGLYNAMFPPQKDYIALWQQIMRVADMWKYSFNLNDRARACVEVYLTRKAGL